MRVLVACEYSGIVRDAFVRAGCDAMSCDLLPTEAPGKHYQGDVMDIIDDGWDLMIAHPPCTYLTNRAQSHNIRLQRVVEKEMAINFFLKIAHAPIDRIAIENPVGIMSSLFRKPEQVIQPFYFGDPHQKTTCLWLKNLRPLQYYVVNDLFNDKTLVDPISYVSKTGKRYTWSDALSFVLPLSERAKVRSKTFPGIANAMAEQWGNLASRLPSSNTAAILTKI